MTTTTTQETETTVTIITTRTDLLAMIADVRPDAIEHGLRELVADRIQESGHPFWGADWQPWIDRELDGIVNTVASETR